MTNTKTTKKDNIFINLLFNIVAPTLILSKFSDDLGTKLAIVVALAFPILYGLKDFLHQKKFNFFSALGVFSVLMTGGMALLELPPEYIAAKEAGIPALFAIVTLISLHTPYPLVKLFLFNETLLQVEKITHALQQHNAEAAFEAALKNASYIIAISFIISSVLNYVLAIYLLQSPPGTDAFNEELGLMTALSFPVIAVPATLVLCFALYYLFKQIKALTQLPLEDILQQH